MCRLFLLVVSHWCVLLTTFVEFWLIRNWLRIRVRCKRLMQQTANDIKIRCGALFITVNRKCGLFACFSWTSHSPLGLAPLGLRGDVQRTATTSWALSDSESTWESHLNTPPQGLRHVDIAAGSAPGPPGGNICEASGSTSSKTFSVFKCCPLSLKMSQRFFKTRHTCNKTSDWCAKTTLSAWRCLIKVRKRKKKTKLGKNLASAERTETALLGPVGGNWRRSSCSLMFQSTV